MSAIEARLAVHLLMGAPGAESLRLNAIKRVAEAVSLHEQHSRRLCKLHERLGEKQGMLSASGAIKLYKAYDVCLQSAKAQLLQVSSNCLASD